MGLLELYCAVVKFLPAILWILKLEIQAVLTWMGGRPPPKGFVWNIRVRVLSDLEVRKCFTVDSLSAFLRACAKSLSHNEMLGQTSACYSFFRALDQARFYVGIHYYELILTSAMGKGLP